MIHARLFQWICSLGLILLVSCNVQKQIAKGPAKELLSAKGMANAHVGISIYDPQTGKFIFNHNSDKYFVPASNTKIPTCYAAMKYLKDSLVGLEVSEYADKLVVRGTGDPTLLDPEFSNQPVFDFLIKAEKPIYAATDSIKTTAWGSGWSWGDYDASYMPERSALPIYCNLVWFYGKQQDGTLRYFPRNTDSNLYWQIETIGNKSNLTNVTRRLRNNSYRLYLNGDADKEIRVPFITNKKLGWQLLADTLKKPIHFLNDATEIRGQANRYVVYSQPLDSMLQLLMHRSDNFFAEQTLLMVSRAVLGTMSDADIIKYILEHDFKDLPQKPRWADGSGLSRYNLFTPEDFVAILHKMQQEFGMERLKVIFPTGGEGTLSSYYLDAQNKIFAKTGTLSGVVALSGYIFVESGKQLIFSILVNNHHASATEVRKTVERFLRSVYRKY